MEKGRRGEGNCFLLKTTSFGKVLKSLFQAVGFIMYNLLGLLDSFRAHCTAFVREL